MFKFFSSPPPAGPEREKIMRYLELLKNEPLPYFEFYEPGQGSKVQNRQKNKFAPISRLPIEIMLQIFMLLVNFSYRPSSTAAPWDWLIITKVCQTWRNIALDAPCLWREIRHFHSVDRIQAFLTRSRKVDLVVIYGNKKNNAFIPDHIVNLFTEHMYRVREFSVLVDSLGDGERWNAIWSLFTEPLPRLKHLTLQELSNVTPLIPLNVLQNAINLDGLCVMDLTLPWTNTDTSTEQPLLRNLSILSLMYFEERPQDLRLIMEILKACPNLRNLELEGLVLQPSSPLIYNGDCTIELSQLEYISISPIKTKVFNYLLNHVALPEDVTWDIGCSDYSFDEPKPFEPKLLDCSMRCCRDVTITCDDETIGFTTDYILDGEKIVKEDISKAQPASFCLIRSTERTAEEDAYSLFASIQTILKQSFWSNMSFLTINLLLDDEAVVSAITKSDWLRVLGIIPTVRFLSIQFPWFGGKLVRPNPETALMDAFLEPTNADDSYKVQCPGLETLRLIRADFTTVEGLKAYQSFTSYLHQRVENGNCLITLCLDECRGIDIVELQKLRIAWKCYLE